MTCQSVALFSALSGLGIGLLLALAGMWLVNKLPGKAAPSKPQPSLDGLEVSDSSMGEFDAAVRGAA